MSSRWAIRLLWLALVVVTPPGLRCAGEEVVAAPSDPLAYIKSQCDARNQALNHADPAIKGVLEGYDALLEALEKEAKKEPELATAAAGRPPSQVLAQARVALESVKLNHDLSKNMRVLALQEQSLGDKEPNPVLKLVHYKRQLDYLSQAAQLAQRAADDVGNPTHPERSHTFNSQALIQAQKLVGVLAENHPASALSSLSEAFDGARKRSAVVVTRASDPIFSGSIRAYSAGTVTLANGHTFNVSHLEQAAAGPGKPVTASLIREVPSPLGPLRVVNPVVFNRAQQAAASPTVGGVALQMTFLALGAAGVPGFQGNSPLEGIDQPVLLSLQGLLARLQPSATDAGRWAALPDDLRFPGGIDRILGYVLDPARRDIILVASPAQRPQTRMDLDAIILGLRASWRDNATAYVSLDPSPVNPFGPQIVRVGGIPQDSVMARIMLQADYLMKQIMLGKRPIDPASFRTIVQLKQADPDLLTRPWHARFWFYPKPLGAESVAVSTSGRTVIFNAELQVLTEQMTTQGGICVGTGAVTGTEETAAFEFTQALDTFSASLTTDPDGSFSQLRGLTGIVALGALLHRAGIDYPVLKQFAELPYRHLEGSQAVPKQYPGLVSTFEVSAEGKRRQITIGGGVELVPRTRRGSRQSGIDLLAAHCEAKVDRGEFQRKVVLREAVPIVLSRTLSGSIRPLADDLLLKGSLAFRNGRFESAAREFRAAAALDPSSLDAYTNLAFSLDRLGRTQEAIRVIHTARLLEPDDSAAQLMEFAIRYRTDKTWSDAANPARSIRDLISLYTANARHALNRRSHAQAYAWANDAIAFGLPLADTEAHLIRGLARLEQDPGKAETDLTRALEETKYVLTGGSYDHDEVIYLLANLGLVQCTVQRQLRAVAIGKAGPEQLRAVARDLTNTIGRMKPLETHFPKYSSAFIAGLTLERERHRLIRDFYKPDQKQREEARLVALGESLLQRFPDVTGTHALVGQLQLDLGNPERAIAICSGWLAGHPLDADCLAVRGMALAQTGRCAEARQDVANARRDSAFHGLPKGFTSPCGEL